MKNIYLLQTNMPSKLHSIGDIYGFTEKTNANFLAKQLHIYITSDEEIKKGDWCIATEGIWKNKLAEITGEPITDIWKKIIITNDTDLIECGIQSVDNEFLEWFVDNSTCEFVESLKVPYFDNSGYSYLLGFKRKNKSGKVWLGLLNDSNLYVPSEYYLDDINKDSIPYFETELECLKWCNSNNNLQVFINQFGENGELSNEDWSVSDFLEWLQLNNFKIIKEDGR